MDEFDQLFIAFQDYGAPTLDVYEQAVCLYIFRHTLLAGTDNAVIGFKSARKKMAFGTGKAGTAPSEGIIYEKLRGLEQKFFVKILSSERSGTRVKILTPFLNFASAVGENYASEISIEDIDFFEKSENRELILRRDGNECFYCSTALNVLNYVIEHVISRPAGSNSYRNLVAACRQCNNRKDATPADDFLRRIYREGILTQQELMTKLTRLEQLKVGELKPAWPMS